jgi:hypothetical protein
MFTDSNADASGSPNKLAYVELHDARLGSFTVQNGGSGVLSFSHICVFVEKSFERYDDWSYRADLLLQGIEQLSLDRILEKERSDYVYDGSIIDNDGREIELASAIEWTPADKIELSFFSSTKLSLKVSHVQLKLIAPLEKLEEWIGPLKNSET